MDDSVFKTVPLGDGLFKMGNDIVCSYPLLSTKLELSLHKITYNDTPYKVEVTWSESTPGTRTNPHWQRIYNS